MNTQLAELHTVAVLTNASAAAAGMLSAALYALPTSLSDLKKSLIPGMICYG